MYMNPTCARKQIAGIFGLRVSVSLLLLFFRTRNSRFYCCFDGQYPKKLKKQLQQPRKYSQNVHVFSHRLVRGLCCKTVQSEVHRSYRDKVPRIAERSRPAPPPLLFQALAQGVAPDEVAGREVEAHPCGRERCHAQWNRRTGGVCHKARVCARHRVFGASGSFTGFVSHTPHICCVFSGISWCECDCLATSSLFFTAPSGRNSFLCLRASDPISTPPRTLGSGVWRHRLPRRLVPTVPSGALCRAHLIYLGCWSVWL